MNERFHEAQDELLTGLLRTIVARLPVGEEPEWLVERVLSSVVDRFFTVDSPIGRMYVGVGLRGVRFVQRGGSPEDFARSYRERFKRLLVEGTDTPTRNLTEKVATALAGKRVEVSLDLSETTPFQRRVLEVVKSIPRGEVRPYSWVAREVGSPKASRAVGTALANNPVPLLVPCHRVVKNDGRVGNYAFGAGEKARLLKLEGVSLDEIVRTPYIAACTTKIVCYATCRNVGRIHPENRRPFRSVREALIAGYRSCRVCRPVVT
ncbi:MAG: methylated-DNA--[protein]-cysteine S-methyltransferase [Rubrobacter sp.]|nr:methylated-DNA--[protein]-cysteine S-methyltransferase [Rubrobacter sp.]